VSKPSTLKQPISHGGLIHLVDQVLFAEALSQLLNVGVEISRSLLVAAAANPSRRFRAAIREMTRDSRAGYSLEESLSRTGAEVSEELLTVFAVGEKRNCLPQRLVEFANRYDPKSGCHLAAAVGRSPQVTRFAAALSELLSKHRMTVDLVSDAGRIAAGNSRWFARVMARVVKEMQNGSSLAGAMMSERRTLWTELTKYRTFDPLFCLLVETPNNRDDLRTILARLGRDVSATSRFRATLWYWWSTFRGWFWEDERSLARPPYSVD
jgi:type II secretory pathway component PulF